VDTGPGSGAPGQETSASALRVGWRLIAEIMNLGATNSQWVTFSLEIAMLTTLSAQATRYLAPTTGEGTVTYTGATGTNHSFWKALISNSGAVDTTIAQALAFTVANAVSNANYETKLAGALVEIL
jgi:hypothetical protein